MIRTAGYLRQFWPLLFSVLLLQSASAQTPPNDECAGATAISALPYSTSQNTRLATANPSDPNLTCADGGGGKTVWFRYTPPSTQWVRVSTAGSTPAEYDIALGVLTGECGSLTLVACNDDIEAGVIRQSELTIRLTAGVSYTIHVAEWNGGGASGGVPTGGDLLLSVEETTPPSVALGPRSGSLTAGAVRSTNPFSALIGGEDEPVIRQMPPAHRPIPILPTPPDVRPPSGPEGSNYIEHRLAKPGLLQESRPVILGDFAGVPDESRFIPPDPDIAAGPDHLIGIVNCRFRIWDKAGTALKTIQSWDWFEPVLPGLSGSNPPFDPQVLYDHYDNRWVITYDFLTDTSGYIFLSVSDDADPLGTWYMWALPANQLGDSLVTQWDDYPQLAYDNKALYITSNVFGLSDFAFKHAKLRIIPKAQLYANTGGPITWTDFWDLRNPDDLSIKIFGLQATIPFDDPGDQFLVSLSSYQLGTYVTLWRLSDVLTSPGLTASNIPVVAYSTPTNAGQLGGGSPLVEAGGRQIRNQPVYRDSSLWLVHTVASGTGSAFSALRYVRLNPHSSAVLEDAATGMDGYWHYYSALTVDEDRNVIVTYSRSSATEYIGAFVSGRKDADPPGLSPGITLRGGEANYVKTFSTDRNRWGDYNGIALDPADPTTVWVHTEFAGSPANTWLNRVGKIVMGPVQGVFAQLEPQALQFATTEAGLTGDTLSVTVASSGTDTLVISGLLPPGGNFSVVAPPALPLGVASFEQLTIRVAFTPLAGGEFVDSLLLQTNDPARPTLAVKLSGKGIQIVAASPGILYGTTGAPTPSLAALSTSGASGSLLGPLGSPEIHGLSIRPGTNELFGSASSTSSTTLYRISSLSGEALPVVTVPLPNMRAIAFQSADVLYAATGDGRLYRLLAPGWDTVFVGTAPGMIYSSLAFNPVSGSLWASIRPLFSPTKDAIFRVDPASGDTTFVGRTNLNTVLNHLTFDVAGQLYAVTGTTSAEGTLHALDTLTAAPTQSWGAGINGLIAIAIRNDPLSVSVSGPVSSTLPDRYGLDQNYPNPFNPETHITYALPVRSQVRLTVYSMLGQEVLRLVDDVQAGGRYVARWNGRTSAGKAAASGIYIYRIEASPLDSHAGGNEPFTESRRMILLK